MKKVENGAEKVISVKTASNGAENLYLDGEIENSVKAGKRYYAMTLTGYKSMRCSNKEFDTAVAAYKYLKKKVSRFSGRTHWNIAIEFYNGAKFETIYEHGVEIEERTTNAEIQALIEAENFETEVNIEASEAKHFYEDIFGNYGHIITKEDFFNFLVYYYEKFGVYFENAGGASALKELAFWAESRQIEIATQAENEKLEEEILAEYVVSEDAQTIAFAAEIGNAFKAIWGKCLDTKEILDESVVSADAQAVAIDAEIKNALPNLIEKATEISNRAGELWVNDYEKYENLLACELHCLKCAIEKKNVESIKFYSNRLSKKISSVVDAENIKECLRDIDRAAEYAAEKSKEIEKVNVYLAKSQAVSDCSEVLTEYAQKLLGSFHKYLIPQKKFDTGEYPDCEIEFVTDDIDVTIFSENSFRITATNSANHYIKLAKYTSLKQLVAALDLIKDRLEESKKYEYNAAKGYGLYIDMPEIEELKEDTKFEVGEIYQAGYDFSGYYKVIERRTADDGKTSVTFEDVKHNQVTTTISGDTFKNNVEYVNVRICRNRNGEYVFNDDCLSSTTIYASKKVSADGAAKDMALSDFLTGYKNNVA